MPDFYTETEDFIQIYKFNRSTDAAVKQWSDTLDRHIMAIQKSDPFFILLDVTGDNVEFTSTVRRAAKQIFSKHRDHVGYLAMIFSWRTSPYFARLFFASIGQLTFKLNYFTDIDAAKEWLQSNHT